MISPLFADCAPCARGTGYRMRAPNRVLKVSRASFERVAARLFRRSRVPRPSRCADFRARIKRSKPNSQQVGLVERPLGRRRRFLTRNGPKPGWERLRACPKTPSRSSRRKEAHSSCDSSEFAKGLEPPYVGCYDFSDKLLGKLTDEKISNHADSEGVGGESKLIFSIKELKCTDRCREQAEGTRKWPEGGKGR
jgi:hypothetical protein